MEKRIVKRGGLMHETVMYLILTALIVALFLVSLSEKQDSRYVKRQVLEKQLTLLIESARPGMTFSLNKKNVHGIISDVRLKDSRIYVDVDGLLSVNGYPYFSENEISVSESEDKFVLEIS